MLLKKPLNPYQRNFCRQAFLELLQDENDPVVLLLSHGKMFA